MKIQHFSSFLYLLILLSLNCWGQSKQLSIDELDSMSHKDILGYLDTLKINIAKDYLNKKLGSDFVMKSIRFFRVYDVENPTIAYEVVPTRNKAGKNTNLIYFNVIEKSREYKIDTLRTDIDIEQINKIINGADASNFLIGRHKAIEIAKKAGLKDGIDSWYIRLEQLNTGSNDYPAWIINTTYHKYENVTTINQIISDGECVKINVTDGKIIEQKAWQERFTEHTILRGN